jgi:hypothetical protein
VRHRRRANGPNLRFALPLLGMGLARLGLVNASPARA